MSINNDPLDSIGFLGPCGALVDLLERRWDSKRYTMDDYTERLAEVCRVVDAESLVMALVEVCTTLARTADNDTDPDDRVATLMGLRHMAMFTEGARYFG